MWRRLLRDPVLWTLILLGVAAYLFAWALRPAEPASYHRSDWPHWRTVEVDGRRCSVRVHVLRRELRRSFEAPDDPATASPDPCALPPGVWVSPYTGQVIRDAGAMDVDHIWPLQRMSAMGGARWPRARREAYANDLGYRWTLIPVEASVNRAKGAQGPATWVPDNRAFHCQYGESLAVVAVLWQVRVSEADRTAIARLVATC